MKDKIYKYVQKNAHGRFYGGSNQDMTDLIHDCIQYLGLSNEWVSVDDADLCDDQLCWVKFHDIEELFLMRFVNYRKYGGGHNKWQDFGAQEESTEGTVCVKITEPLPPSEAKS